MTGSASLRAPVTISALAYDVLWESVVGEPHHPALLCDSPGATWTKRSEYVTAAVDELRAADLANRSGVDVGLLGAIKLLNRPSRELYGWYSAGADTHSMLGVATGNQAVVAHFTGSRLTLLPCTPGRLPDLTGDLLPEHSPIRTAAISVPLDQLADDRTATGLLSAPRSGAGEFYLAQRDSLGRRQRIPYPVCYADTAAGRFLTTTTRAPDRTPWLTIAPATRQTITERLRAMVAGSR